MRNLREMANQYRDISLEDVVNFLGGDRDHADPQKWKFSNKSVWLGKSNDYQRFYDHHAGAGGGGAIDLVMYVEDCTFKVAVERLSLMSGITCAAKQLRLIPINHTPEALEPSLFISPRSDIRHRGKVIDYLTIVRGIPHALVQHAINIGQIYADSRRNIVFLCTDEAGQATGAEIRGTDKVAYKGMATGSQRGVGFFTLNHPNPISLVLVESAIDAISYRALYPSEPSVVISTAGVLPQCPALAKLAKTLCVSEIVIAYDNDDAGDASALKLIDSFEDTGLIRRRLYPLSKDWNDYLTYCLDLDFLMEQHNG
jgi:hypothetical protein